MPKVRGLVHLGSLRLDGAALAIPDRPWLVDLTILKPFDFVGPGNIAEYERTPDFLRWSLGDTTGDETTMLRWVVVEDGGRELLICDRVILVRVSWDDLDGAGYIRGREITIDGRSFRCRVLSGGQEFRIENDGYAGGTPDNEWDRIIAPRDGAEGWPALKPEKSFRKLDTTALDDPHNKLWNWFGAVSWTSEPYKHKQTARVCRGFHSAGYFYLNTQSHRHEDIGWRPVLEQM